MKRRLLRLSLYALFLALLLGLAALETFLLCFAGYCLPHHPAHALAVTVLVSVPLGFLLDRLVEPLLEFFTSGPRPTSIRRGYPGSARDDNPVA